MRILGIDPGSVITGIGIIDCKNDSDVKLISCDAVSLNPKSEISGRLKTIYDSCIKVIKKFKPDELAIETAFYGKNIQSTLKLGQARGVVIIAALNMGLTVSEYSPREIKKSVTGNGSASKEQVQFMIKKILKIKVNPEFIDSSDALAVALCHSYALDKPVIIPKIKKRKSTLKNQWNDFILKNPEKIMKL